MFGKLFPPLSGRARSLLAAERGRREEDAALAQRLLTRARAAVERDRPSGFALRSLTLPSAGRRSLRTVALAAAAIGVAGFAAAGAGLWRDEEPQVVSSPNIGERAEPRAVAVGGALPLGSVEASTPVEPPAPPRARSSGPASTDRARPTSVQQYKLELTLLEPARSSIARRDYAGALTSLGEHQRAFPGGLLAEEREALRVRALWGMGQVPAAEAAARAFRKRYPRSLLLGWMKSAAPGGP